MHCPACGHSNAQARRFCANCGSRLEATCTSCGTAYGPGEKFCGNCGTVLPAIGSPPSPEVRAPAPTSIAGGRYLLRQPLGEGSKKRVYLGHDTRLGRDVAISLIKREGLDEGGLARVQREARAMGSLGDHPHVVTVHDIGDENGQPFIVSQYMAGGSVDDLLRRAEKHRLSMEQAVQIADQVCQALEYAHRAGVVHRDLKPGNVWLTRDGTAKLGDFGLAIALERSRLTLEGMMVGTVAYMPPEQALGRKPEPASDLYALGAMLYEMVTGRPPFLGDDAVSVVSQHINTPPVAPSWHNPEVPRALEALIMRLLAKVPEERPDGAVAVRQALGAIAAAPAADAAASDEVNPLDRLAGGVFVGREREMDQLRAALEDTLSGRGRLLMLVGEPGIGKTRMAEEFVTYARLRKARVLWGRSYDNEGAPAYWPWVQAIRAYVHDREPSALLSEMGSGAGDIAQVVSEVRERLPGLSTAAAVEPEQARFRLFDAVTTFLKNVARAQPLVLVLDDLHWADRPSLLLLQFLTRELRDARLLVVGTYRDVELRRQHPLSKTLGELTREGLTQRILLRGLTERDVARFIEMTAGVRPPVRLTEAVYKETEGNPFFVNEVVRLLVTDGRLQRAEEPSTWTVDIPQGVREVIGRRLDHLTPECNRVLTIASVIGREFSLEALQRICDLEPDAIVDLLDDALAARVILEVPGTIGRYAFAHALIGETLYEELSSVRRLRLHRQVGEALEDVYGAKVAPHLAELAHHFLKAAEAGQDVDKAIDYAVQAAARADSLVAYEEAVTHYDRALQALELRAVPDPGGRCELLLSLGAALRRAGDRQRARETFQLAASEARTLGAAEQLARAALGVAPGFLETEVGTRDDALVALLEEALAALGESDGALRARLLSRLAMALYWKDPAGRRASLSDEALEIARGVGDAATLAHALSARHVTLWGPDNVEQRLTLSAEVSQLADAAGERELALRYALFRCGDLLEVGDRDGFEREAVVFEQMVTSLRQPLYFWYVPALNASRALLEGRLEDAERLALEGLSLGQRVHDRNTLLAFGVQMAVIRRAQNRVAESEPALERFAEQPGGMLAWQAGLAWIYADVGRLDDARRAFELFAADGFTIVPRNQLWLTTMTLLTEACTMLADAERAAVLYELLLPYADRYATLAYGIACYGSIARFLAVLATTLSRWDEAAHFFERALEMNQRLRAPAMVAEGQYDYARMLLLGRREAADRPRAFELLNGALETARVLGLARLLERTVALKLEAQGRGGADAYSSIDAVTRALELTPPDLRPHAAPDGAVAIMFTDIEGSTAMTERLGDLRAQEILRAHNAIVREQVRAFGGFEVKSQGDGFMIAFESARRALLCAIGLQRAIRAHTERHLDAPIRVRMGVHCGEVLREANDFFGKHVILAARIASQAHGGEILTSAVVRGLTEATGDICFHEPRHVELKGLSGTYAVCAVEWEEGRCEIGIVPPALHVSSVQR